MAKAVNCTEDCANYSDCEESGALDLFGMKGMTCTDMYEPEPEDLEEVEEAETLPEESELAEIEAAELQTEIHPEDVPAAAKPKPVKTDGVKSRYFFHKDSGRRIPMSIEGRGKLEMLKKQGHRLDETTGTFYR